MLRRLLTAAGCVLFLGATAGMGFYFFRVGPDRADQAASVISAFLAFCGLAVAVIGVLPQSRPAAASRDERAPADERDDLPPLISRVEDAARVQAGYVKSLPQDARIDRAQELQSVRDLRNLEALLWRMEEARSDGGTERVPARPPRLSPAPRILLTAAVAGTVVTAVGTWLWSRWGAASVPGMLTIQGVGMCFLIAGILAWRLKPQVPAGPWMIVLALLTLVSNLHVGLRLDTDMPGRVVTVVLGTGAQWLQIVAAGRLLLACSVPTLSAGERRVVTVGWILAAASPLLLLATKVPVPSCHGWCGTSPISLTRDPAVYYAVRSAHLAAWILLALSTLRVLVRRYRHATDRQRHLDGFSLLAGSTVIILFVLGYASVLAQYAAGPGTLLARLIDLQALVIAWAAVFAIPVAIVSAFLGQQAMLASIARLLGRAKPWCVGRLQSALRKALRDPTLAVVVPNARGILFDAMGRPVVSPPPERHRTVVGTPPIAVLLHDPSLTHDRELLDAAAAVASLALSELDFRRYPSDCVQVQRRRCCLGCP
ncbi:hypothetical protein GCM10022419_080230 [Nonomuraea rosea]|uniref:Uncharacterized protein n=2 Tax=Nonomuraea rosea TaxID=638574 RepID=A0ABP6YM20_9ACTN